MAGTSEVRDYTFTLNGTRTTVRAPGDLSVLWTLRDKLGVTGPKYGCGINVCKACTSHVDGQEFNPCVATLEEIEGRRVTTIEGLAAADGTLTPVQQAWVELDVAQCGFCQPGQIMVATALLDRTRTPSDAEIDEIDNVCRCGTYARIRGAIRRAAELMDERGVTAAGLPRRGGAAAAPAVAPVGAGAAAPGSAGAATPGSAGATSGAATPTGSAPVAVSSALPTTGGVPAAAAAVLAAGAVGARALAARSAETGPAPGLPGDGAAPA